MWNRLIIVIIHSVRMGILRVFNFLYAVCGLVSSLQAVCCSCSPIDTDDIPTGTVICVVAAIVLRHLVALRLTHQRGWVTRRRIKVALRFSLATKTSDQPN